MNKRNYKTIPWPVPIGRVGHSRIPSDEDWQRFREEKLREELLREPGREKLSPGRKFPVRYDE